MSTYYEKLKKIKEKLEEDEKRIKVQVPKLNAKNKAFKNIDRPLDKAPKVLLKSSKAVVFKFHDKLSSVKVKDHYFTNMIESKHDNKVNNALRKIFSIDGKELFDEKDIPFTLNEEEKLNIGKRHTDIMNTNGVYGGQTDILKCTYMDAVSRLLKTNPKGTPIRVYYVQYKKEKIIILIDVYHLFADTKAHENYNKHNSYNMCMNALR